MSKVVRVCVVGCGRAGLVHAQNLAMNIPEAQLVALVDANEEAAKRAAFELGVRNSFPTLNDALNAVEIDAVVIATPTFTHASLITTAASQGKHVFSEKPLCITLAEADLIKTAVKESGVKFQIGFMRRFDANFLEAKRLIDAGAIGKPILVKSVGRGPGLPPLWYMDPRQSNGLLAEVNSHDFDAMRWFVGSEFKWVFAVAQNFKCPEYRSVYPEFYDTAVVIATFEDSTLGVVDGCCPAGYGYDARMEILGHEGVIYVGSQHSHSVVVWNKNNQLIMEGNKSWRTLFRDAYLEEMRHFIQCIKNDEPPKVGLEDGIKALEVVLAANASIRTGEPVEIKTIRSRLEGWGPS